MLPPLKPIAMKERVSMVLDMAMPLWFGVPIRSRGLIRDAWYESANAGGDGWSEARVVFSFFRG
ncbi:MAG: hypothetical protein ETSY2_11310 [Candidatus Entotheonella gemina]|uniref:Uncharacterized protein n=1 Tax=Candidatus Entotheonella gemina TaxID=1429439 RepID=W4MCT0_9BACT|nr:MAG: hypothetical protein ETSY2_11310 [Candidatus Entotheonella gemina]